MEHLPGLVFEAIPGFEDHLVKELETLGLSEYKTWGDLYYAAESSIENRFYENIFWHQNCWLNPLKIKFDSINEAAKSLRSLGRNWAPSLFTQYRRASLISSKLPALPSKKRSFPWLLPDAPMGAFTLLDANTMIASQNSSSPFPNGIIEFEEDKLGPPGRAYLKLWEALTLCHKWPKPGEKCLDAGASPGSWTWALLKLGADVIAVDRALLDPKIAANELPGSGALPGAAPQGSLQFLKHDAFTLKPQDIGRLDWLFCDVICYPPRLYEWIQKWLDCGLCENFICTIKMQGAVNAGADADIDTDRQQADFETPKLFAQIPGSKVVHLCHNKHELTWMRVG